MVDGFRHCFLKKNAHSKQPCAYLFRKIAPKAPLPSKGVNADGFRSRPAPFGMQAVSSRPRGLIREKYDPQRGVIFCHADIVARGERKSNPAGSAHRLFDLRRDVPACAPMDPAVMHLDTAPRPLRTISRGRGEARQASRPPRRRRGAGSKRTPGGSDRRIRRCGRPRGSS